MSERGIKKIWVDTMVASGTVYKWGLVNLSNSNTVITPTAVATAPYGLALDDAADGEAVPVLRLGRAYVYDVAGTLNNGDYILSYDSSGGYHKAVVATVGTSLGVFGRIVGDDGAAANDLLLAEVDFIRHDK